MAYGLLYILSSSHTEPLGLRVSTLHFGSCVCSQGNLHFLVTLHEFCSLLVSVRRRVKKL